MSTQIIESEQTVRSGPTSRFSPASRVAGTQTAITGGEGAQFDFGGLAVQWKIDAADTGGRFSVVHHPIAPHALAAPMHFHHREDEYSYVLGGTLGALLGDKVVTAGAGTWVFKPRGQWHTFWNAGDAPCELIEVISPDGFEDYSARSPPCGAIAPGSIRGISSKWTSRVCRSCASASG